MKNNKADSLQPLSDSLKTIDLTGHPPVDRWNPEYEGEIDIVIRTDGTWLHEGTVFQRDSLVRLFASVLWFEDGIHYLKTPAEKMRIVVEEVAFFIPLLEVVAEGTPQQQLIFTSTYGDRVVADAEHAIEVEEDPETGEPRPYLNMRYGMRGKLSRNVFYQLAELAELQTQGEQGDSVAQYLMVRSSGKQFVLGSAE
ncbi:MAG: DUF1285 domain-containing protein [Thiolinea sp.]